MPATPPPHRRTRSPPAAARHEFVRSPDPGTCGPSSHMPPHDRGAAINAAGRLELVPMSRPAPPALTVRYDGSTRTFAAGNDVVIGRDLRADVRIAHPLISRAHLVLRFDQGRWVAIDNGSLNGMFVNGRRVPTADIHDGQAINIGNPDGPQLRPEER